MNSYLYDLALLFLFAFLPPIILKKFIKKHIVWRALVGPSAFVGLVVGYYVVFK